MAQLLLFLFQVIMAWVYMVPQTIGLIAGKTAGLTLAMWVIFLGYLFLSFSLAIGAWRENRDRIRLYTVLIFGQWVVFILFLFLLALPSVKWNPEDTFVCLAVAGLSLATIATTRSLKDPMTRGWLAVWCKGVPQLYLAYFMWQAGSAAWLPGISLLATDLTCLPRLLQVFLQGENGGWDRATKALFLGELANVVSWGLVNVIWLSLSF